MAYSIELTLADALQMFVPELFIQQFLHWNRRSHLCGPSAFRQTKTVRCEQTHKNAVFGRGCVNTSSGKNHLVSFIKGGLKNKKQAKKTKTGLLSWDIREGWRQDLGIFFLFFVFLKSWILYWVKKQRAAQLKHANMQEPSIIHPSLISFWMLSKACPLDGVSTCSHESCCITNLHTFIRSTRDMQHRPQCHALIFYSCVIPTCNCLCFQAGEWCEPITLRPPNEATSSTPVQYWQHHPEKLIFQSCDYEAYVSHTLLLSILKFSLFIDHLVYKFSIM